MCIRDSLNAYYDAKIFENDPFAKLDQTGVGKLMETAIKLGKPVNNKLHVGIRTVMHDISLSVVIEEEARVDAVNLLQIDSDMY